MKIIWWTFAPPQLEIAIQAYVKVIWPDKLQGDERRADAALIRDFLNSRVALDAKIRCEREIEEPIRASVREIPEPK